MLKLTLHATGYDWQFVPVSGGSYADAGTGNCHVGTPGQLRPPPPPPKPPGPVKTPPGATGPGGGSRRSS